MKIPESASKALTFSTAYFALAFPSAFFSTYLPAIMRAEGVALEMLWVFSLPLLPFWIKWLIAPAVDSVWWPRLGRRNSWITPATLMVFLFTLFLGLVDIQYIGLWVLVGLLTLRAVLAMVLEVAIDAYLVDSHDIAERPGAAMVSSISRIAGYLFALLVLGSVYRALEWRITLLVTGAIFLASAIPIMLRRDQTAGMALPSSKDRPRPSLRHFLLRKDRWQVTALMLTSGIYTGSMAPMLGVFLVDAGLNIQEVGIVAGTTMFCGVVFGSAFGYLLLKATTTAHIFLCIAVSVIPASVPLLIVAPAANNTNAWVAFSSLLPIVLLLSLTHYLIKTIRIGYAAGPQSGTDYSIISTLSRVGQTIAVAGAALVAGHAGWQVFFIVQGAMCLLTVYTCVAFLRRRKEQGYT